MTRTVLLYTDSHSFCGVGVINAVLLEALQDAGYRTLCAQRPEDTPLQARLKVRGIEYHWFDCNPEADPSRFANDKFRPAGIFAAARPDLVLFSNGTPMLSFSAVQTARFLGIPYVIREGLISPHLLPKEPQTVAAFGHHYRAARAVVATCQQNLDLIKAHFSLPLERGCVVVNGPAPVFFEPVDADRRRRLRAEIGVGDAAVLCFTVAKLEQVKGHDLQLRAIEALQARPEWQRLHFAWAGEGSRRAEIESRIRELGVADRVTLLGHRWDVASWLDAADIFVLPSRAEGICNAMLEALAKGLPTVVSAVGGLPEALGDTGRLIAKPSDPDATVRELVETIAAWAADDALRQRVADACRGRASAHFSQERMVAEYLGIIERAWAAPKDSQATPSRGASVRSDEGDRGAPAPRHKATNGRR